MKAKTSSGFKPFHGRLLALLLLALSGLHAATVQVELSHNEFSPDGDGLQDVVWLDISASASPLYTTDWVLTIRNSDGETVRQIQADRRRIRPSRSVNNLFLPGRYDVRSPFLPERLYWNGLDDSGKRVRDGVYRLSLQGELLRGGYVNESFRVRVDTRKPNVNLAASQPVLERPLSPGGDIMAPRGEITIIQRSSSGAGFRYLGQILDDDGDVVEERQWKERLPASISWNGREPGGSPVDPGNYSYRLVVSDAAGNTVRKEIHGLYVTAGRADIVLNGSRYYSPRGPALSLETVSVSGGVSVAGYEFQILSGDSVIYRQTGGSRLPVGFNWNGGQDLSGGYYSARIIMDRGGRRVQTPRFTFYLDQSGTDPSLSVSQSSFTPDGDYDDDVVTFSLDSSGPVPVDDWTLSLVITSDSHPDLKEVFMAYQGKGVIPSRIVWDGTGSGGRTLESYETIVPVLTIRNEAGTIRTEEGGDLETGVVLRPITPGGIELVARFPNKGYFDAKGVINSRGEDVVNAVLSRISRYPRYFLRVECHSGIPGREEENLERTEEMAYTIFQKFFGSYWPTDRMTYMGAGETEALYESPGLYESYRNDRMEFRLEYDNFVEKQKKE